jgi:hypothetical protein
MHAKCNGDQGHNIGLLLHLIESNASGAVVHPQQVPENHIYASGSQMTPKWASIRCLSDEIMPDCQCCTDVVGDIDFSV